MVYSIKLYICIGIYFKKRGVKIQQILFIHPDTYLLEFIKEFLNIKGFEVNTSSDCVAGFTLAAKIIPDLIILNKEFPNFDAKGFLTKKRTSGNISFIPVFVIGDFSTEELVDFKKENVTAFLSSPVDPNALAERLYIFFNIVPPPPNRRTPMLVDINSRGKIIVIQVEGNLEPTKAELCNYLLRAYCRERKIKEPRFFFIIPSLFPESITNENIERLFKLITYPELNIESNNIKILTNIKALISLIKKNPEYEKFEFVKNYFEGIHALLIDFDKEKSIPVEFLKPGSFYIFDLYDKNGKRIIPALTKVDDVILGILNKQNISYLTYYGDETIQEVEVDLEEIESVQELNELYNTLLTEYEPVDTENKVLKMLDEKHMLYFQDLQGEKALVVTTNESIYQIIKNGLEMYFDIVMERSGANIEEIISKQNYIIIFLDSTIQNPSALDILGAIRKHATRKTTSVIILAQKIDKASVVRFKNCGTDNIIVSPFSPNKIRHKVLESVSRDRNK